MALTAYRQMVIVSFSVMFTITYTATYILPYMPDMTLWMGYQEEQKGYYVGIIASCFYVGGFLTNYPCGVLADKYGHRKVIVILLVMNAIVNLITGFVSHIYTVCVLRFLAGNCGAMFGLSRAIVSLYSDNSNQGKAMAANLTAWLMGMFVGSAVGGYCVSLTDKYPHIFGEYGFLIRFPYIVPPVVAFVLSVICVVLTYFMYPNDGFSYKEISDTESTKITESSSSIKKYATFNEVNEDKLTQQEVSINDTDDNATADTIHSSDCGRKIESNSYCDCTGSQSDVVKSRNTGSLPSSVGTIQDVSDKETSSKCQGCMSNVKNATVYTLLRDTNIVKTLIVNSLVVSSIVCYREMFPVWASTKLHLGGLDYSTDWIGCVYMIVAIPSSLMNMLLYPYVEKWLGAIPSSVLLNMITAAGISLLPMARLIKHNMTQWLVVCLVMVFTKAAEGSCVSAIMVIMNNCVPRRLAGSMQGLATTLSNLATAIAPLACGPIYAASITANIGPPIDSSMAFVVMCLGLWVASMVAWTLPRHLNVKLIE